MITKEKFLAYENVRQSGLTNMFDISEVINLAEMDSDVTLTKEECLEIMKDYCALHEKYIGEGEK